MGTTVKTSGTNDQTIGTTDETLGTNEQTIGTIGETVGTNGQTVIFQSSILIGIKHSAYHLKQDLKKTDPNSIIIKQAPL